MNGLLLQMRRKAQDQRTSVQYTSIGFVVSGDSVRQPARLGTFLVHVQIRACP